MEEKPHWPVTPILAYGTLGTRSAAERRYHWRSGLALAALVCVILLARQGAAWHSVAAITPGLVFAYIAWEFWKYLAGLDELARRMQLESIALTYLIGLPVAVGIGGLGMSLGWKFNAAWFIVLEPVRAMCMYLISRRYQ